MSGHIILDGKGTGYRAEVDSSNRLVTKSVSIPLEHYLLDVKGSVYTVPFTVTPNGDDHCFLAILNTSTTKVLTVHQIIVQMPSGGAVQKFTSYLMQTGTPSGGVEVTPVNLNTFVGSDIAATVWVGTDITGLSDGSSLGNFYLPGTGYSATVEFQFGFVLGPNMYYSIYVGTGSIAMDGALVFSHHMPGL